MGTCFFFSFLSCYMKRLDGGRSFLSQMKYSRLPEKWQTDSTLSRFYYLTLIFTSWQLTAFIVFLSKYFQLFVWILLNYPSVPESDRVTTRKKAEHQKQKAGHSLRHLYDGLHWAAFLLNNSNRRHKC